MATQFDGPALFPSEKKQRTFLGHPVGLYVLFFTEMWERFSYYGMRALLILYMVNYFKMSQEDASGIYKWYTSLVYLTPLLGGYLADRYLGNKRAVIIGALLMAVGHFLMAFEDKWVFYSALIFLIFGNGFFKPNMSTQVGRLYPQNDARRDGAYTIFYMGINLGAFLSPLVCGWLAENTLGKYHSGFTVAGIGMVCGLLIYLFGLRWVVELDQTSAAAAVEKKTAIVASNHHAAAPNRHPEALSEEEAERTPSVLPDLNRAAPGLMMALGGAFAVAAPVLVLLGLIAINTAISYGIAAVCFLISAWILSRVHAAIRDRVLAIYVLGLFVVFFWAAFEQAGNAMNLWADKTTNRYLTSESAPPELFPTVREAITAEAAKVGAAGEPNVASVRPSASFWVRWQDMFKPLPKSESADKSGGQGFGNWWSGLWNPVPTAWFQSINALAIFVLAPLFAMLWTALGRRGWNPSIPTKMALGVLLMSLSFAVMIGAARREDQPSSVRLRDEQLPAAILLNDQQQLSHREENGKLRPYHAGRLRLDPASHTLQMSGVLSDTERDEMVRATAPPAFVKEVKELQRLGERAGETGDYSVPLSQEPPGFDMKYAGFKKGAVWYDSSNHKLHAAVPLADKDVKALLVAAGDPQFRETLNELMVESSKYRVSAWWLFWFYILATLGELCLSPVGLSMVSKLAPARFATMLMGLWLLTSFFGNFVAGAFGEQWGTVPPAQFFAIFLAALGAASLVLFVLVRKIVAMMHGVN